MRWYTVSRKGCVPMQLYSDSCVKDLHAFEPQVQHELTLHPVKYVNLQALKDRIACNDRP